MSGLSDLFRPRDGNDRNRDVAGRDAAPVIGTYICDDGAPGCPCVAVYITGNNTPAPDRHCWHESTRRRLEWQYGENRVDQDDIARWNALGTRKAVAA